VATTNSSAHLNPAAIEAAWTHLWSGLHGRHDAMGRMHTQTLVVLARQPSRHLDETLDQVGQTHPGRVVMLYLRPRRAGEPDRVTLCGKPEAGLGSELVCVTADAPVASHWAELVLPLLLPDVPVYLYIADTDVLDAPELQSLVETVDHVVLDTAADPSPWVPWRPLFQAGSGIGLLDLAWARTAGWREVLAAAFDPDPCLQLLPALTEVTVTSGHPGSAHWLMAWLASRLGYVAAPDTAGAEWTARHRPSVGARVLPRDRGGLQELVLSFPEAEAEAVVRRGRGTVRAEVRQAGRLLSTTEAPRVGPDTAPQLSAVMSEGFDPLFAEAFRWLDRAHAGMRA
jgi:glucose-6-phosphate dehydrogenase assembly protein OpcA